MTKSPWLKKYEGCFIGNGMDICAGSIEDYFNLPKRTKEIRLVTYKRETPDTYKIEFKHPGYCYLFVYTTGGMRCSVILEGLEQFLVSSGAQWVGIEYR